jgi:membrane-bound lytic murein transglycosylase D
MGHKQLSEEELKKTETVSLMGKYNSKIIAQKLVLDLTEFNKLNPGFDKALLQGNTYEMRLPIDKLPLFKTKKQEILEASVQQFLSSPDTAIATVVKAS